MIDLSARVGRRQAFGLIATTCSAADAEACPTSHRLFNPASAGGQADHEIPSRFRVSRKNIFSMPSSRSLGSFVPSSSLHIPSTGVDGRERIMAAKPVDVRMFTDRRYTLTLIRMAEVSENHANFGKPGGYVVQQPRQRALQPGLGDVGRPR